ncbi:MAG: hypothetical protein CMH58_10430 [Myxococcales bacterium]|nr:hypothetical protein [Myxococcales bacterium]|tara:strand:- start:5686 stop:6177 length:492 start_codon:yes stop_codon:yes gene_type:complete
MIAKKVALNKMQVAFPTSTSIQSALNSLNNSKLMLGIMMLLLNIGSRYIELGFTKTQEQALRNGLGREILIFAISFMGTHDIVISILMTASFIILSDYLFNEQSRFCVLPARLQKIAEMVDKNDDNEISPEEERKALETLQKAETQKKKRQQSIFNSYLISAK